MAKARTLVGLDVHAAKIVAAVLDVDTGEVKSFAMKGDTLAAVGFCAGLPRPVRVAYEAGPTGYGLARGLAKRGVECVVAAPSKIPRATGDRVKTDARDAEHIARLLLAGKLHAVRVPGPEEEALRDLVRARETLRSPATRRQWERCGSRARPSAPRRSWRALTVSSRRSRGRGLSCRPPARRSSLRRRRARRARRP